MKRCMMKTRGRARRNILEHFLHKMVGCYLKKPIKLALSTLGFWALWTRTKNSMIKRSRTRTRNRTRTKSRLKIRRRGGVFEQDEDKKREKEQGGDLPSLYSIFSFKS